MQPLRSLPNHGRLLRKLTHLIDLPPGDREVLLDLPVAVRHIGADGEIVRQGDKPDVCTILLDGFACRARMEAGGRRQIVSFHVPGDMPDIQSLHVETMDHALVALQPTTFATIEHRRIDEVTKQHAKLSEALWRETLLDASMYRRWIFLLGRRPADVRLAHTLCELSIRFHDVGMARQAVALPIRQSQLADALGLTPVHVSRVLRELREKGLVVGSRSGIEVLDLAGLQALAEFDCDYLRLTKP